MAPLLDARTMLYKTYLQLDNAVKAIVRSDAVCQRLMTVPGVGAIISLTFKVAVDDPSRFRSSRTVAAHFGLTHQCLQRASLIAPDCVKKRDPHNNQP